MKMIKGMGLLVASLFIVGSANAYVPYQGYPIAGSAHDFSVSYAGEGGNTKPALNLCNTCHEMHKPAKMDPLWGRQNPDASLNWKVQSHGTEVVLDQTGVSGSYISAADFVNARSGMCMSCHDGVTAIANTIDNTPVVLADPTSRRNFGTDLTKNHNVGRKRTAYTDPTPEQAEMEEGHDHVDMGGGVTNLYLGCGTCHSMHHSQNQKLVRTGPNNTICLNCHSTK